MNCENELLKNENIFTDESLMLNLEDSFEGMDQSLNSLGYENGSKQGESIDTGQYFNVVQQQANPMAGGLINPMVTNPISVHQSPSQYTPTSPAQIVPVSTVPTNNGVQQINQQISPTLIMGQTGHVLSQPNGNKIFYSTVSQPPKVVEAPQVGFAF